MKPKAQHRNQPRQDQTDALESLAEQIAAMLKNSAAILKRFPKREQAALIQPFRDFMLSAVELMKALAISRLNEVQKEEDALRKRG